MLAVAAASSYAIFGLGGRAYQVEFLVAALAVILILIIARRTQRAHEALIMPKLAEAAGLTYATDAAGFAQSLPPRLLPKAGLKRSEDVIWGQVGGRMIRFAEMKYETGGKNSSTLFKGIVVSYPNLAPMPSFFLAAEKETMGGFLASSHIKVADLVRIRSVTGGMGVVYGVWAGSTDIAKNPRLDGVLKVLTNLQNAIGSDAQLYTASSNGEVLHLAFRYKRDLFKIGGLFAGEDKLIADIKQGYHDLTLPLTIARKLLEAEKSALAG